MPLGPKFRVPFKNFTAMNENFKAAIIPKKYESRENME
jgi:hypothetical protein